MATQQGCEKSVKICFLVVFQKSECVPLKVRIMRPDLEDDDKKDISVYDFDDDKKDDVGASPIGAKTSVLGSPAKSPGRSPSAHPLSPRVCLCLYSSISLSDIDNCWN